jgi:hypothetical protein
MRAPVPVERNARLVRALSLLVRVSYQSPKKINNRNQRQHTQQHQTLMPIGERLASEEGGFHAAPVAFAIAGDR